MTKEEIKAVADKFSQEDIGELKEGVIRGLEQFLNTLNWISDYVNTAKRSLINIEEVYELVETSIQIAENLDKMLDDTHITLGEKR